MECSASDEPVGEGEGGGVRDGTGRHDNKKGYQKGQIDVSAGDGKVGRSR